MAPQSSLVYAVRVLVWLSYAAPSVASWSKRTLTVNWSSSSESDDAATCDYVTTLSDSRIRIIECQPLPGDR